ncbi:phiSA1p31-related protein [Streptomyces zaomyceticus]|uniref:phiSA1p31-related protein n=1 Tax=Streptomyces zaomyceticus TaxID=68286 RepID=UPI0034301143
MTQFKVGDTVKVLSGGEGVITYGPVNSTYNTYKMYVVKQDGDDERTFQSTDLTLAPKFAIGDTVTSTSSGCPGTSELVAGPFKSTFQDNMYWVAERSDGKHATPYEHTLTKVAAREIKVGDRVRILRATFAEHCHGKVGTLTATDGDWRAERGDVHKFRVKLDNEGEPCVAEVELVDEAPADTCTYDGVTYDLTARYRDKDHDHWKFTGEFATDGTPLMTIYTGGHDFTHTLTQAVADYGPLYKI